MVRKSIGISLDVEIIEAIKKRSAKRHEALSRTIEEILRKGLRL